MPLRVGVHIVSDNFLSILHHDRDDPIWLSHAAFWAATASGSGPSLLYFKSNQNSSSRCFKLDMISPLFFSFDTVFFSFQLSIWLELQFEGVEQKFNASCWTGCWTLPVDLVDKYSSEISHQHDGEQIESMAKQSNRKWAYIVLAF